MVSIGCSPSIELSFLFQRLKWPVPMVRWRAAKEIRNLLNDTNGRRAVTDALLNYLERCETETEVCEVLTVVFLASPEARPSHDALGSRVRRPSMLADIILEKTYGKGAEIGGWHEGHSGDAPTEFKSTSYFEEHKTAHAPPVVFNQLRKLKHTTGFPFLRHWAYEWQCLRDKRGTRYTRYPYYFEDFAQARSGIVGQYWQRMRDNYLSAYLRTLAYAVSEWGMPQNIAEGYCLDLAYGTAGLFDVEPGARPAWLADIPERACDSGADLQFLVRELVQEAAVDGMRLVSLSAPIASRLHKYAKLTLSAHLVTPDYEFPAESVLYERESFLLLLDTFELKGPQDPVSVADASTDGGRGTEVAVCNKLIPIPFGQWQVDYLGMGLPLPETYVAGDAEIRCEPDGINLIDLGGATVSRTRIWNDDWTSSYPRGGTTRCGVAAMIDEPLLGAAQKRLHRDLAWFARLSIWERETEYGDYTVSHRTAFVID